MYTALRATSLTLAQLLRSRFIADPVLAPFFDPALGGTMLVSLNTPQEMAEANQRGLSLWLYRILRDELRLNAPRPRPAYDEFGHTPLPLRLHYLVTPIVDAGAIANGPELEHTILGKVLQIFHDSGPLRGALLRDDFTGTDIEINVRFEPQSLEEITRVWDALERSYQLCVSYEVSVVEVESERPIDRLRPVEAWLPEVGVVTSQPEEAP